MAFYLAINFVIMELKEIIFGEKNETIYFPKYLLVYRVKESRALRIFREDKMN